MLKVKIFRAVDYPEECMRYINGHRKVLEAYGVTKVTSASTNWMYEPYTYLISVVDETEEKIYGGCRLQLTGGKTPLPIETAINAMDPGIYRLVQTLHEQGGTGEFCGLWNSREVAGWGIGSMIIGRAAMAVLNQLPITTLLGFCAQATFKNSQRIGFKILTTLGNNGTFYYPKEDLIATALIIEDPLELSMAHPEERGKIMELRDQPYMSIILKGPKGTMDLQYYLELADGIPFQKPYYIT
ncbi:MAG TPA: hypothetical protein VGE90_15610 [Chitinophaga sp.]